MVDNSTSNVTGSFSSGGSGQNIDVTNANLLQDTTIKDFRFFLNGTQQSNSDIEKVDQNTLKVNINVSSGDSWEVRRVTPPDRVQEISFGSRFSSALWEDELNRASRRAFEYELNGTPGSTSFTAPTISDAAFASSWDGNTSDGASKNALYDIIIDKADIDDEDFTGTPTAPTPSTGDNSTRIATTEFVQSEFDSSPVLGGDPTVASIPSNADRSKKIAPTQWVGDNFLEVSNDLSDINSGSTAIDNIGALDATENLSDINDAGSAIDNLGALDASENLSDVDNSQTSRENLNTNKAFAAVKKDSDQTISSGSTDTITFDTELVDDGNQYDLNANHYVAPFKGMLMVTGNVSANFTSADGRRFEVKLQRDSGGGFSDVASYGGIEDTEENLTRASTAISKVLEVEKNDVIRIQGEVSSTSGSADIKAGRDNTSMEFIMLGER